LTCCPRRRFALGATLVLLMAAALRLWALDWLPGGIHFDLAAYLFDAVDVIGGARPLFFTRNTGREPFVIYLYALAGAELGATPFTARLVTDAFGMLSVAAIGFAARQLYALARPGDRHLGDRGALLSAGLMAGLYWSVHFSRFGLRTASLPALLGLAFALLLRGMRRDLPGRRIGDFALAGVFLGLSVDSYTAARLAAPAVALPLLVGFVAERHPRWLGRLAVVGLTALVVFAPLGLYYWRDPTWFVGHSYNNSVLNPERNLGDPVGTVVRNVLLTAAGYVVRGSPGSAEDLPGRPIFEPLAAVAFVVGIVVLLGWLRRPLPRALGALAVLGWLAALSLTSVLSVPAPGFVRLSGAIGGAVLVAAVGGLALVEAVRRRRHDLVSVAMAALVVVPAAWTAHDYFGTWADQYRYRGAMVDKQDAVAYLYAQPPGTRLFLSPLWATDFGVQFLTRQRPLESFAAGAGLVIPTDPGRGVVYAFPYEQRADAELLSRQLPGTPPVETVRDASARYDLLQVVRFRPSPELAPTKPQRLEDGLALADASAAVSGDHVDVTLRWFTTATPTRDYWVTVQLRDEKGTAAQHDGMPIDGSSLTSRWQPGDLVVDRHTLKLPPGGTAGRYKLYAWFFDLPNNRRRLRLLDDSGHPAPVNELQVGQV
jgi:hypothetical protein